MYIDSKQIDKLISRSFVLDCHSINIKQQTENNPIIYTGSGSIFQNDEGVLCLKMIYSSENDELHDYREPGRTSPGILIESDKFFHIIATDIYGAVWESGNNDLNVSHCPSGKVIEAKLVKITTSRVLKNSRSKYLKIIIDGKATIPATIYEEIDGCSSLVNCPLDIDGVEGCLIDEKDHLLVSFVDSDKLDECFIKRFIQALDIIFGKKNHPLFIQLCNGKEEIMTMSSLTPDLQNKESFTFIKHNMPFKHAGFQTFITCYMKTFEDVSNSFYGFWHKIHSAWQSDLENTALALAVSIEGVAKEYFGYLGHEESSLLESATLSKPKVEALDVPDRIKFMLVGRLDSLQNPNPKTSLYALEKLRILEKKQIKNWEKLRNKAAHAVQLDDHPEELQKYLNLIWSSSTLFNLLLMYHIDYSGEYSGWRNSQLTDGLVFSPLDRERN
jgi:hypothetical protein